jgi:hypothetical protein
MKKISLLLLLCLAILTTAHAQIPPNAFNYSAVARNAAGDPIATSTIGIQITILKTSPTGASQYMENHFVNTDAFGLFNLVIGAGAVQSGNMATIDWSNDNYYLKVGMDATGGSSFVTMGTTQLLSVPYALYAKSAGSVSGGAGITIDSVSPTGDTLFLSNGQIFFGGGGNGGGSGNLGLPTVTTNAVTMITSNSAHFGGSVTNASDDQIIEKGIVYSTLPNPTYASSKIEVWAGAGAFDTTFARVFNLDSQSYSYLILNYNLDILSSNTTYYVRAYAITANYILYGNEVSFSTLPVGQTGPGGGIVFFDRGNNDWGWQYLEVAASDQSGGIEWGCEGNYFGTGVYGLSSGHGEYNTSAIIAGCNDPSYAAKLCADLNLGGQNDWFLPSVGELFLMRENLFSNGLGDFIPNYPYWSSSDWDHNNAWYFNFSGGDANPGGNKGAALNVRAIRAF